MSEDLNQARLDKIQLLYHHRLPGAHSQSSLSLRHASICFALSAQSEIQDDALSNIVLSIGHTKANFRDSLEKATTRDLEECL